MIMAAAARFRSAGGSGWSAGWLGWCGRGGEDGAGHDFDRLLVGEALVYAQGVPGPERGRGADDRAGQATLAGTAAEWRREYAAVLFSLIVQLLLVCLWQRGEVAVNVRQHSAAGAVEPVQVR